MCTNRDLWKGARLALCSTFERILNKKKECLVSLKIQDENGVKTIDLTPEQAKRVLSIIKQETEAS